MICNLCPRRCGVERTPDKAAGMCAMPTWPVAARGKIVMVNPNTIVIETSDDRVRMELTKWAVSQVGVQTGEQPEAEKKEKKAEKKEETPAVEAPKADEDEKN